MPVQESLRAPAGVDEHGKPLVFYRAECVDNGRVHLTPYPPETRKRGSLLQQSVRACVRGAVMSGPGLTSCKLSVSSGSRSCTHGWMVRHLAMGAICKDFKLLTGSLDTDRNAWMLLHAATTLGCCCMRRPALPTSPRHKFSCLWLKKPIRIYGAFSTTFQFEIEGVEWDKVR